MSQNYKSQTEYDDIPSFCIMTQEERKAAWKKWDEEHPELVKGKIAPMANKPDTTTEQKKIEAPEQGAEGAEERAKLTELTRDYNVMALSAAGQLLGKRAMPTFKSIDAANAAITALQSSMKAKQESEKAMAKSEPKKAKAKKNVVAKAKKKVAAKKPVTKKKVAAKKGKTPKVAKAKPNGVIGEFGLHAGGPREKLLNYMHKNMGKTYSIEHLAKQADVETNEAASMIWRFGKKIENKKLKYKIKIEKTEGRSKEYGLAAK